MSNWKKVLHDQNAKVYIWPEGWDTREQVAEQLECAPDRVSALLAPGLKSGDVESKPFPVWENGRMVRKVGYRVKNKDAAGSTDPTSGPDGRARKSFRFDVGDSIGNDRACGKVGAVDGDVFTLEWDSGKTTRARYSSLLKSGYKLIS